MPEDTTGPKPSADEPITPTLEIAHVLFMDIVAYSKLPLNRQRALIDELQQCVRTSSQYVQAQAMERLVRLPTGDGMALVFFGDPLAAVNAALEVGAALKEHPDLKIRTGVHSGPVYVVEDINGQKNVTGSGINIAQRIMDCGDAGHILVSQAVAEVLNQLDEWDGCLESLGEAEVKHEVRLPVYRLARAGIGNEAWPAKLTALQQFKKGTDSSASTRGIGPRHGVLAMGVIAVLALMTIAGLVWNNRPEKHQPFERMSILKITESGTVGGSAISLDGKYVAYTESSGPGNKLSSIKLKHLATGSTTQVLAPQEDYVHVFGFTPDGSHVIFSRQVHDRDGAGLVANKLPVLGGPAQTLPGAGVASFSPTGKQIAFARRDKNAKNTSFLIADSDGSGERVLATRQAPYYSWKLAWSPDGKTVAAFLHVRNAAGGLDRGFELLPLDGSPSTVISSSVAFSDLTWLPDGSGIIGAGILSGESKSQVWFQPLPKGEPRLITNDFNSYGNVSVTSDSKSIVTTQYEEVFTTWAREGTAGTAVQIPTGKAENFVGWTPKNELILTTDHRLTKVAADGSTKAGIFEKADAIRYPAVCGNGTIVFSSIDGSKFTGWAIGPDGAKIRTFDTYAYKNCSRDGKWVLSWSKGRIALSSLETGQMKDLPVANAIDEVLSAEMSPDGQTILLVVKEDKQPNNIVAQVLPLTGGKPLFTIQATNANDWQSRAKWSPDGKSVTYVVHKDLISNIWLQPVPSGSPRQITYFTSDYITSFGWSRDGKLAVTRRRGLQDVVMITSQP